MKDLFSILPGDERDKLRKNERPEIIRPMLATLTANYFSGEGWIFERKFDGVRCIAIKTGDKVTLMSRNGNKMNETYPELVDNLMKQPLEKFIVDGEIVAFKGKLTSFTRLQARMNVDHPDRGLMNRVAVYLYLFDMLHAENYDLKEISLKNRKSVLKNCIQFGGRIRYSIHRNTYGKRFHKEACRKNWEGLIAKKSDSIYVEKRSADWLKFKCVKRQELIIGGFTDPEGERKGFGALLVGFYDHNRLKYAGKVGTGYDERQLKSLRQTMDDLESGKNPFAGGVKDKNVHWIKPELVAEIGFTEWTESDKLRHPRFLGLRNDKDPATVVKEMPETG